MATNSSLPDFRSVNYTPKGISIVIPNYNGKKLFETTLGPLFSVLNELVCAYEVIVVDDRSTDDSVAFVQLNYPAIKLLQNEVNSGFSKTINKGIMSAAFELVFLLNSDIILTSGYFAPQFKYFNDENTFGVMGRIVGWDDEIIQDAARYPDFHGTKIKTSTNYLFKEKNNDTLPTLYLSGANALVKRDKLVELGGFDELYSPFYIEDCDLSFRAWRLGWKCYYEHASLCRHRTSSSINSSNKKKYIQEIYNRNKLFLHYIHLDGYRRISYFVQTGFEALFKAIIFKTTLLKSFALFFKNLNRCGLSRKNLVSLASKKGVALLTMANVAEIIKATIGKKPITKFKSGQLK